MDTQAGRDIDVLIREEIMEDRLLVVITSLRHYITEMEESIPRTDPKYANILKTKQHELEEAKKALEYYRNLFIHRDFRELQTAQEIEGSCEGCMHFKCEYTEFPCCDCCRASRDDRYEKNSQSSIDVSLLGTYGEEIPSGERLCDFYPTLHSGEDANHET